MCVPVVILSGTRKLSMVKFKVRALGATFDALISDTTPLAAVHRIYIQAHTLVIQFRQCTHIITTYSWCEGYLHE